MVRSVSPTDLAQKAFVRGLSDEIDEESLRRAFTKFGEVVEGMLKFVIEIMFSCSFFV